MKKAKRAKGKTPAKAPRKKGRVERTTTKTTSTRVRKVNPRHRPALFALVAKAARRNSKPLRFTGSRFASHGNAPAVLFRSVRALKHTAGELRRRFGKVLRNYSLYAEPAPATKA